MDEMLGVDDEGIAPEPLAATSGSMWSVGRGRRSEMEIEGVRREDRLTSSSSLWGYR